MPLISVQLVVKILPTLKEMAVLCLKCKPLVNKGTKKIVFPKLKTKVDWTS